MSITFGLRRYYYLRTEWNRI